MNAESDVYQAQLDVAITAARAAADVIEHYFQSGFDVTIKADETPVTIADVESEKAIREVLLGAFPEYGFYGEETGSSARHAEFLWLVDPIDGTKSFVRGLPFFSTQIALMHRGRLVVGVSNAPHFGADRRRDEMVLGEMATACAGGTSRLNDRVVQCSSQESLQGAFLSSGNLTTLAADAAAWQRYAGVLGRVARVRGYGDFCHYHQLAAGQADLVIESDVNILDIAALTVVVEQAGGVFTDLSGAAIGLQTTSVLAASTPQLHAEALAQL